MKRRFNILADSESGKKECAWCHEIKLIEDFTKRSAARDGLDSACKDCRRPGTQAYYIANRQTFIDKAVQWNREHPELRKQYNETWLQANLEEQKQRRSVAAKTKYWSDPEKWRLYYKDAVWKNHLWRNFGLTVDEYVEMLVAQNYCCAICHEECKSGKRLGIDHDHSCCGPDKGCKNCIRGLLCVRCNGGIGLLGDDADRLVMAIAYILFHKERMMLVV